MRRPASYDVDVGALRAKISTRRGPWLPPALTYALLLFSLLYLYVQVPVGFPEQWAGRDRLPDQSFRVSRMYRDAAGLAPTNLPVDTYRMIHLIVFVALWLAYALAVAQLRSARAGPRFWSVTVVLLLLALAMPPLLSTDVFYYGITGEAVARYGANPHVLPPSAISQSPLLAHVYWRDFPSPYGPVWTSVSAIIVAVGGNTPLVVSLAFKIVAAFCVALSTWIVYRLASRLAPGREAQAVALWAWNPLVLLETAANGHNDALLALVLLGSLWLISVKRGGAGYVLAALSIVLKLTTVPALALLTVGHLNAGSLRQRAGRAIALLTVLSTTILLAYFPYWEGPQTLQGIGGQPLESVHGFVPGTISGIALVFTDEAAAERAGQMASLVALSVLGVGGLWAALRVWRAGAWLEARGEGLVWGAALVLVPLAFVRAYPWYVVPGLALLAAVWPHCRRLTLWLYGSCAVWFIIQYGF
ncbi:MAG: hypothetical protein H0V86_08630 [Chloroflexia bacterium]|nr:hypothetical protein [Chloroflexia bacterium]